MPTLRPFKPASAIARLVTSVLLAAALAPAGPLGTTPSALAANLLVNSSADPGDGTCDGTCTLRDAILGAALSVGPDTITFSAGVTSTIVLGSPLPTITEALTIDGTGQSIRVDGANAYRPFFATAPFTLTAITVQRGRAPADAFGGGGAYFGSAGTILNSIFMSNTTPAHSGGGAWIEGAGFVSGTAFLTNTAFINAGGLFLSAAGSISGSTFISNSAGLEGGGAYLFAGGAITGSTFTRNQAVVTFNSDGGGAEFVGPGSLANTHFISNTAVRDGGGVKFYGAATITGGSFSGNAAGAGGGAYLLVGGAVTNTTFMSNTAFADGGALYTGLSVASLSAPNGGDIATITGATFTGNRAEGGGGGGAYLSDTSTIKNSTFTRNSAASSGGGIYSLRGIILNSTVIVTNTAIIGGGGSFNTASVTGGGFFGNTATGSGGGARFIGEANINGATFRGNTSIGPGGGAYFGTLAILTDTMIVSNTTTGLGSGGGGASFGPAIITGTTFISNTAADGIGGGGFFGGSTVMTGTIFTGNKAACGGNRLAQPGSRAPAGPQCGNGGGAYTTSQTRIRFAKWSANEASLNGGAIYVSGGDMTIENSQIDDNTAGVRGGGTFVVSAEYRFYQSYSRGNQAGLAGGGLFAETSLISLDNDVFAQNNTVDASGADDVHLSPNGTRLTSRHVTYVSPSQAGYAVSVGKVLEGDAATFINTIFDGYGAAVQGQSPTSTIKLTGVLWSNITTPFSVGDFDVNQEFFGSAAFVNAPGGDYHLTVSSAALNRGVPTNLTVDLDGSPRNIGGAPDLGAFEYGGFADPYKVYTPLNVRF